VLEIGVLFHYGLIIGILWAPWLRFLGTGLSWILAWGEKWGRVVLLLVRSGFCLFLDPLNGLNLFDVLHLLFSWMMVGVTWCVGRMVQRVSSLFVVLGTLFIPFRTKWRGANLFGINMLSRDFFLFCGLLFVKLSLQDKLRSYDVI